MNRIQKLESFIFQAREDYYNNQPTVSDTVFDAWVDELRDLIPDSPAIVQIGASVPVSEWQKAEHRIPMGSLNKANTEEEIQKWIKDCGLQNNDWFFLTEKIDGISIELVYENGKLVQAISRGDGHIGENIVQNVKKMKGVVLSLPEISFNGSIRGEIFLKRSIHQKYFFDKANPRNAASGIAKRLDGVGCEHLNVFCYQILGNVDLKTEEEMFKLLDRWGCEITSYHTLSEETSQANSSQGILPHIGRIKKGYEKTERDFLDYDIDGLVIRVNDFQKQKALGQKHMRPEGALAIKFAREMRETIIEGISWQVGLGGRLTPVAHIKPVHLAGATISNASIYNVAYIQNLKIDVGARVLVSRAGDIIPRIEEVVVETGTIAKHPEFCPSCEHPTMMIGEILQCSNVDECPAQIIGRIKTWINTLNILEWGDRLIEKLVFGKQIKNVSDLYCLTVADLEEIDRMGKKSATKCYEKLWEHNPVALEKMLGGLGIPLVAEATIKMLIKEGYDSLDKIFGMVQNDFESVDGIGSVKAKSLYEGLLKNQSMVERLIELGVKVEEEKGESSTMKKWQVSVVFTGKMQNKREVLARMAESQGATVQGSVSKGTTYLVIADPLSTTVKANRARELGTILISEEEFLQMVK